MFSLRMLVTLLIALPALIAGFRAYDCLHSKSNRTTVALTEVSECMAPTPDDIHVTHKTIQVVQEKEWMMTHIHQCNIDVVQTIHYCGMHSHISAVDDGLNRYILDITQEQCLGLIRHGTTTVEGNVLSKIPPNSTTSVTASTAGQITMGGKCKGASFSTPGRKYSDVVVQSSYLITLRDYSQLTDIRNGIIVFPDGVSCSYAQGRCQHPVQGSTFWTPSDAESCTPLSRLVIYEGPASFTSRGEWSDAGSIVSVHQGSSLFSLKVAGPGHVCHQDALRTDHARVHVIVQGTFGFYFSKHTPMAQNIDLTMYMNSKISYVTTHLENALKNVYAELTARDCDLERQTLTNRLAIARQFPVSFGNILTGEPGYYSVVAGEVLHMVQCQAVEVTLRRANQCFKHLPITYNNRSTFMEPFSKIISNTSLEVPCSEITPPMYQILGKWFALNPTATRGMDPHTLRPREMGSEIPFEPVEGLLTSGIYDERILEDYRRFMSFPLTKVDVSDFIASRVSHESLYGDSHYDTVGLFSYHDLDELAGRTAEKIFGFLYHFGAWAGAVWGVLMIWKVAGKVIGMAVNTCHLYSVFGLSFKLLAAVATPVTHWLVHRDVVTKIGADTPAEPDNELKALCDKYPRVIDSTNASAPNLEPGMEDPSRLIPNP